MSEYEHIERRQRVKKKKEALKKYRAANMGGGMPTLPFEDAYEERISQRMQAPKDWWVKYLCQFALLDLYPLDVIVLCFFVKQLMYFHTRKELVKGHFFCARQQVMDKLHITEDQERGSIERLKSKGYIRTRTTGCQHVRYIKIDCKKLETDISKKEDEWASTLKNKEIAEKAEKKRKKDKLEHDLDNRAKTRSRDRSKPRS